MTDALRFDHLVVAVHDLQAATDDYTQLGFQVTPGGRHTHAPTRNALIYLPDDAYIELIEWMTPVPGERWYQRLAVRGEGVIDFALCPSEFPASTDDGRERYRAYPRAIPGSRVQANGEEIRWQLGWPDDDVLPFLCADVTPRERRVPPGSCRHHPNGAIGIREVSIEVNDLEAAVTQYERLLSCSAERMAHDDPQNTRSGWAGSHDALFQVGATQLHLFSPQCGADTSHSLRDEPEKDASMSARVYQVTLACSKTDAANRLDPERSHGVQWLVAPRVPTAS